MKVMVLRVPVASAVILPVEQTVRLIKFWHLLCNHTTTTTPFSVHLFTMTPKVLLNDDQMGICIDFL